MESINCIMLVGNIPLNLIIVTNMKSEALLINHTDVKKKPYPYVCS